VVAIEQAHEGCLIPTKQRIDKRRLVYDVRSAGQALLLVP
jgi:hypothetical protein